MNAFAENLPTGVTFRPDTIRRIGALGDNWCITWAADDSQITSMCDGNWLEGPNAYNNHLYRLVGSHNDFERKDLPNYPSFLINTEGGGWFGYGICSVQGDLYSFVSKCPKNHWSAPFRGVKLLKSPDNGDTWYRVNRKGHERLLTPMDPARYDVTAEEMFFFEEDGRGDHGGTAYPFASCSFVQNGRDNTAAKDDYVYIHSPEGARTHELLLARAPRGALGNRGAWEYFAGRKNDAPQWSPDLAARKPVHFFPETGSDGHVFGWYSWLPSVVWNQGIGLYIMVNGGTYAGPTMTAAAEDYYSPWMHTKSGSLGLWYAENPWGPWTRFFYDDEWKPDEDANLTYQPELSPKWISPDGKRMVLIWSDAQKNDQGKSHTVNYKWNQMEIVIQTKQTG